MWGRSSKNTPSNKKESLKLDTYVVWVKTYVSFGSAFLSLEKCIIVKIVYRIMSSGKYMTKNCIFPLGGRGYVARLHLHRHSCRKIIQRSHWKWMSSFPLRRYTTDSITFHLAFISFPNNFDKYVTAVILNLLAQFCLTTILTEIWDI